MDCNTITFENDYYNSQLINSLKNNINKIGDNFNESSKSGNETLNKYK